MTDFAYGLLMLLMMLPFWLLCWLNSSANIRRPLRYQQYLMPLAGLILGLLVTLQLESAHDTVSAAILHLDEWLLQLAAQLSAKSSSYEDLVIMLTRLAAAVEKFTASINVDLWSYFIANTLILLGYILVKLVVQLLLRILFHDGPLFQKTGGIFYEYDEQTGVWHLKSHFGQARPFLLTLYVTTVVLGTIGVIVSGFLFLDEWLDALFCPVLGVAVVGELYFFLNGLTRGEQKHLLEGEAEEADHIANYSIMRDVLRKLFPDKLNAEKTTISDMLSNIATNDELLCALEDSDNVGEEAYGRFMRMKSEDGMELDFNYLLSGKQLLNGESVLFNNPFYYDLIPYMFFPMNRALLQHKKVLIVLGRHGVRTV